MPRRGLVHKPKEKIRSVTRYILPAHISAYAETPDEKGVVFRYMFAKSGKLMNIKVFIEDLGAQRAELACYKPELPKFRSYLDIAEGMNYVQAHMDVRGGERMVFKVEGVDGEAINPRGIWISATYRMEAAPSDNSKETSTTAELEA